MIRNINPYMDFRALHEVRSLISDFAPNIVSLHTAKAGAIGRIASVGLDVPVIYTPHGWTFAEGVAIREAQLYRFLEKVLARFGTPIVNVSNADRNLALENGVGKRSQHVVIHNGMPDIPVGHRAKPGDAPVNIVMIARFEEQKDHQTLLSGLAQCSDLPWNLNLIGTGPKEDEVKATVNRLGLKSRVHFWGYQSDIPAFLSRQQIFLLISKWEGFPRSILEAMRAGLPVVASDVGGVREAVVHGSTGFTVPREDTRALATYLRKLLKSSALREKMGQNGRKLFEEAYTFDEMYSRTRKLFLAVAE